MTSPFKERGETDRNVTRFLLSGRFKSVQLRREATGGRGTGCDDFLRPWVHPCSWSDHPEDVTVENLKTPKYGGSNTFK